MVAFDEIEEDIRRREEKLRAREIKVRMAEMEKELEELNPRSASTQPANSQASYSDVEVMPPEKKPGMLSKKVANVGKFCLVVVSVIVAVRLAAWIGTIAMVAGITWMAYKLFLESKEAK